MRTIAGSTVERLVFGALIIGGYFGMGAIAAWGIPAGDTAALALTHDAQITVGPLLGVIVNSIWRNQVAEKTAAALVAKTPDTTQSAPIPVAAPPA